jgi:hypothetical protein
MRARKAAFFLRIFFRICFCRSHLPTHASLRRHVVQPRAAGDARGHGTKGGHTPPTLGQHMSFANCILRGEIF